MPIDFVCPNCFRPYSAPEAVAGRAMSCAGCGLACTVPAVASRAAPPPPRPRPAPVAAPEPRVIEWADESEDEEPDADGTAELLALRRRRKSGERARTMFALKLVLRLGGVAGIVLGLRAALGRIEAFQQQHQSRPVTR